MFKAITYDVEHGNSHALLTPNNELVMIDAGNRDGFSPSLYLKNVWGIPQPRWLTITHHDSDHLSDIANISKYYRPMALEQPDLTREQLLYLYNNKLSDTLEEYLRLKSFYQLPLPPMSDPSWDWGGVQFATFSCKYSDFEIPKINNLSVVTFARYQGWTIIFPGDLEEEAWLKLMEIPEFCEWLSRTDIFVASHHGREAGYTPKIFELCSPQLTIISDKSSGDTSVTDWYCNVSKGLPVKNKQGFFEVRKVVTTRSDGAINVSIDFEGRQLISIQ